MTKLSGGWEITAWQNFAEAGVYCVNHQCAWRHRLESARIAIVRAQVADRQRETLARNHALIECWQILTALERDVEPAQPFSDILGAVFRVGIQRIEASIRNCDAYAVALVRSDLEELIAMSKN